MLPKDGPGDGHHGQEEKEAGMGQGGGQAGAQAHGLSRPTWTSLLGCRNRTHWVAYTTEIISSQFWRPEVSSELVPSEASLPLVDDCLLSVCVYICPNLFL